MLQNAPAEKCAAALYAVACLKQPEAVRVLVTCVPIEPLPIGGMGQHLSLCPKSVALLVVAMPRALLSLALVGLPIRRAGVWLCLQVRLGLPGCLQQPGSLLNSIPMACGLHGVALVWPAPGVGECFGAAPVLFRLQAESIMQMDASAAGRLWHVAWCTPQPVLSKAATQLSAVAFGALFVF